MITNSSLTKFLAEIPEAVSTVISIPSTSYAIPAIEIPSIRIRTGVLISFTGHMRGWILMEGERDLFGNLGENMFGMALHGTLLDSFIGEMGNIIVGHLAVAVYKEGISIDISPPTVITGETQFYGFKPSHQIHLPHLEQGEIRVFFKLDEK